MYICARCNYMSAGPGKYLKSHSLTHTKKATFLSGFLIGLLFTVVLIFAAGTTILALGDPASFFDLFRAMVATAGIVIVGMIARVIFLGRKFKKHPVPYNSWASELFGEAAGAALAFYVLMAIAIFSLLAD